MWVESGENSTKETVSAGGPMRSTCCSARRCQTRVRIHGPRRLARHGACDGRDLLVRGTG
jgi:hypothetical protein